MKRPGWFAAPILLVLAAASVGGGAVEPEWPQWRGPDRTGLSRETGLLRQWPPDGPPLVWKVGNLGSGYGAVSVKEDRIYVQGGVDNESVVFCLKRADGSVIWKRALGVTLSHDRGHGPRGTPTIEGDRLYALSENGDLACLKTDDGSVVWATNILKSFQGQNPRWLISESPLVEGNRLIVTPGGTLEGSGGGKPEGAAIVALDKNTGRTVWTSRELDDRAGYSSCVAANVGSVRVIAGFTASAGVGVRASDGHLLWRYPRVANRTANVATPIVADNKVFYSSAYGTGGALLALTPEAGEVRADEVYFSTDMMNHHGGVLLIDGFLYGFSNAILTCLEFATGATRWKDRSVGKGALAYADGRLYIVGENNMVGLAEATPDGYRELGRFPIEDQGRPSWAHPVVCGGKLYVRNQGQLYCFNVKAS